MAKGITFQAYIEFMARECKTERENTSWAV